jgi:glycosyltransferase involved in cell wall biosynthesis
MDGGPTSGEGVLVVLPAWNEEDSVALVVKEAHDALPDGRVLVVDDGSTDRTAEVARRAGATVISSPFNLGVGGAMRIGFRYAQSHGYACLVQVDADGQHDPRDIGRLVAVLDDGSAPHVVIGARFSGTGDFAVPRARRLAMRLLAVYLSHVTRTTLTDVTSGFRAHNRSAIELFARDYPADYLADTVESLVISTRAGGHVTQVPVAMRPRYAGSPSQSSWWATAYLLRVMVMLVINIVRHQPSKLKPLPAPAQEGRQSHPAPAQEGRQSHPAPAQEGRQ